MVGRGVVANGRHLTNSPETQGNDGRIIEKIHFHTMKKVGKKSLVDQIFSTEVWLKWRGVS